MYYSLNDMWSTHKGHNSDRNLFHAVALGHVYSFYRKQNLPFCSWKFPSMSPEQTTDSANKVSDFELHMAIFNALTDL